MLPLTNHQEAREEELAFCNLRRVKAHLPHPKHDEDFVVNYEVLTNGEMQWFGLEVRPQSASPCP